METNPMLKKIWREFWLLAGLALLMSLAFL